MIEVDRDRVGSEKPLFGRRFLGWLLPGLGHFTRGVMQGNVVRVVRWLSDLVPRFFSLGGWNSLRSCNR